MALESDPIQLTERRLLLFSTRIRFTPHTQPIRETAIDKILEQNLLLCDKPPTPMGVVLLCAAPISPSSS
jgi:hypothetical protein